MPYMINLELARRAFADYKRSEGCSCCRNIEAHDEAETRMAHLLAVKRYSDDSGWDWTPYQTPRPAPGQKG